MMDDEQILSLAMKRAEPQIPHTVAKSAVIDSEDEWGGYYVEVELVVNWVKLQPILRYHVGNRRETWESSMIRVGTWL